MPEWTPRFGTAQPLSANYIGRQGMPMMQPTISHAPAPTFRSRFQTTSNPERPYSDVGKMSINMGAPGVTFGQDATNAQGFLQGLGAGAGRMIGGVFGKEAAETGADIGEFIGGIGQAPLNVGANILGALPAMPGLPGMTSVPGLRWLQGTEEERAEIMKGWDGNPLSLIKQLQTADRQDWLKRTDRGGDISPLFRDIGGAASLGDQVMATLGLLGVGSKLVSRTFTNIGGGQDTVDRIMNAPEEDLNEEVKVIREDYRNGVITKDRFLDELTMNNAGYANNWAVNLVAEMVLDPVLLLGGVTGGVSKAAIGARMAKAENFVKMIGDDAYTALSKRVGDRVAKEGGEVTNAVILQEAKNMGLHADEIAEATKQLNARQRWLDTYAEPLEPVFAVAKAVNDPFSMIGRRGTKPVANAWLTAQAVEASAESYGIGNFRSVQSALQKLGKRDRFDRAMGYFAAQEGMFMQGDLMADDVLATRRAGAARPTDHALAQLRSGGQNYKRQLETHISRRKVDLTRPTGLGTAEANMAAARVTITKKLSKMAGITMDEAGSITRGLDADGLSMIDAAYFGHRIHLYNTSARAARSRLSSVLSSAKPRKQDGAALEMLDRTTLIGPRELTSLRAESLREALAVGDTAAAAEAARDAIRRYDRLGTHLIADGTTDAEVITSVTKWLDDWEDTLTAELTEKQRKLLPKEMLDNLDPDDGYIYGMRPEGEAEWRIKQDPETGEITSVNPWIDIVGDAAAPWETRFSNDTKVGNVMNALDRAVGAMSHAITTERIFNEARQDFVRKGMNGYVPNQTSALTYESANKLWKDVLSRAQELGTTARGMSIREFEEVLEKNPDAVAAGLSARDLMGMTLHSFEGRLSTVGVTQKFTGKAKSMAAEMPILPSNMLGSMAERIYPLVRFSYNPFFQLQEWVEPWVFAAARGKQARLSGGWIDPVTGIKVEPDEVMRQQQYLIDRYKAANPYAQFDMMERSLVYLHGSKAAKDAAKSIDGGRLDRAKAIAMSARTTADRKAIAQSEMFRHFLGPILKDQLNSIDPTAWANLERIYGTSDMGTIAVRWLTEKDIWAATDPAVAHYASNAVKARRIGAQSPVDLDATAKHTFQTTREALTLSARDGSLTLDDFAGQMRTIGADETFISNTWKALQFDAKVGGVDSFWDQAVKSKTNPLGRPKVEVAMARLSAQAMAEAAGISEVELLSRMLNGHMLTIMQDDLIAARAADFDGYDFLFQQAKYAESNWFTNDPVTGAIIHEKLDPAEAEARFLAASQLPPSGMPVAEHGRYAEMEKVEFGAGGRSLYIPGGVSALEDIETPFTSWEAHIIRNQLVDPNELLDPQLKHALYEKMWRGHIIEMDKPENAFKVFNNTVMAMLSAGLNLTRNELISTRLRVNSVEGLKALADEVDGIIEDITRTLPPGREVSSNDLGLAYSTNIDVANYVPLDALETYAEKAFRPGGEAEKAIRSNAGQAKGYLDSADRALHAKTMRAAAQRDAVASATKKADSAVKDAQKAVDEATDPEKLAKAEAKLAEKKLARESIDPEQALRDLEEADELAIETNDLEAIADAEKRAEKAVGRISEWAVDQAVEAIRLNGFPGIRELPGAYKVPRGLITGDPAAYEKYVTAAARLAEDPTDLAARDVIRELVPGAAKVDADIVWKPWNVNGAGDAPLKGMDGAKTHGEKDIFAYIKNDDVKWRGFSTNGNIGNALKLARDMRDNPQHFVRRRGAQYAPEPTKPIVPAERGPRNILSQLPDGPPGEVSYIDNADAQDMIAAFHDENGKAIGYVRVGKQKPEGAAPDWWKDLTPGKAKHIHVYVDEAHRRTGIATKLYDFMETQGWDMSVSGEDVTEMGRAFSTARRAEEYLEPLDEFAERLSHRSRGLSLKTGYFGIDLGDPMSFNRGVMDTHMVGDLTEWMYYDVTKKGTDPRWGEWLASLSPAKQKQIQGWLDRDWVEVPAKDAAGKEIPGKKVRVPHPEKAPRGAGTYDWSEAIGKQLSLKGPKGAPVPESVIERATLVRDRINKSKALTEGEKARLYKMYRTDEELAELFGRDIKVLGGDYQIFDDLMAERKGIEELDDPNIARYGHGGYQWKLWDDRRKVYDPETSAFAGAHGIERRSSRFLASSDEMHFATGFTDKGGLRPVSSAGYRYLDPIPTVMTQEQGGLLRGATISMGGTDRVIAITENANSSTLVHELAHALLEPLLDPSGKSVVLDDINAFIRSRNTAVTEGLDRVKAEITELDATVRDAHAVMQSAELAAEQAKLGTNGKVNAARKAERDAASLKLAATEQRGKVKALSDTIVSRRKAINAAKNPPSVKARQLASVDKALAKETKTLDTLVQRQLDTEKSVGRLWDEANAAEELAASTADEAKRATDVWKGRVGEWEGKQREYRELAVKAPEEDKLVWDEEVSEHLAQQYEVWLRTGKASNPKMRDAMAYFHRVLTRLENWLKGNPQVKVSPAMQDLFDRMHTAPVKERITQTNPVPFDATQEAMHQAGRQAVVDAEDAAFTNVQFRRGRSWAERSLNHPYFGIYPFSYMWGKVAPEMIRALAINPFGLPIPGMLEGSTPFQGFVNAQRTWNAVEMQKDTDPEFRAFMNDPQNDKMFRALAMFMPATPWDIPANFPLWSRRFSEWGLESQARTDVGKQPKGFDMFKTASEVTSYAFGPSATLDWMGDVARMPQAPAISQFTEGTESSGSGIESLSPNSLVAVAGGMKPLNEVMGGASQQLQQTLKP